MKKKIKILFVCMFAILLVGNFVLATTVKADSDITDVGDAGDKFDKDDDKWWSDANKFWNGDISDSARSALEVLKPIKRLITIIGNMVFIAVTVILGVKYIWGAADSKASVKDSMVTLVIAAIVFYGWDIINNLILDPDRKNLFFLATGVEDSAYRIYSIVLYICNFLAIGGLVFIGVKYLMAGAEGRAQLKVQSVPVVLGIVMVYATLTFLNLIVSVL